MASPASVRTTSPRCASSFHVDAKRWNEMIARLDAMQSEIKALQQRNFEKDRGKEFESSYTRVIFLMVVTYFTLLTYMALVIKSDHPYLDAIVPTVGFNISTWSLPYVKEWWIQARHYYIHGETERTSLRRLMIVEEEEEETSENEKDVESGGAPVVARGNSSSSFSTQKTNKHVNESSPSLPHGSTVDMDSVSSPATPAARKD